MNVWIKFADGPFDDDEILTKPPRSGSKDYIHFKQVTDEKPGVIHITPALAVIQKHFERLVMTPDEHAELGNAIASIHDALCAERECLEKVGGS